MNDDYSEKEGLVFIQGKMSSVYSGKKWIVFVQGRNE